ncbi:MAG: undecaprenyldiphospho-muramoylpentapeptide beta-N-acetylglucosaminyltransferase [Gemmatimonadales bacterium]
MKILIAGGGTGGHLSPALALAEELRRQRPDIEPVLVGAERGVEAQMLPGRPCRYHLLPSEPIYRRQWWKNAKWIVTLPRVMRAVRRVLDQEQPAVVIGTGGYASGPVLWAAARRGIPIVLQEQNAYPGIATRRLAGKAAQIHLGFAEGQALLRPGPNTQVMASGNPVSVARADRAGARRALGIAPDARVLFVFGGSQGADAINTTVSACLDRGLLQGVTLLWGTGRGRVDAWTRWDKPPTRIVRGFWDPIAEAYAASDLVLSRAGAMTVAELAVWGLPAILVPLPTAAANHQTANARALAESGAAVLLPQAALTPERLDGEVQGLVGRPEALKAMSQAALKGAKPEAARYIVEAVLKLVTA